jgi:hypothetical protein
VAQKSIKALEASASDPASLAGMSRPPISGNYYGTMKSPQNGKYELDLRVDVDASYPNSPVLNRVSGDIFEVFNTAGNTWRVYKESWICESPDTNYQSTLAQITGNTRSWSTQSNSRALKIIIPWNGTQVGPATVTISDAVLSDNYECSWKSTRFREIDMEIDVCKSVNSNPLLANYSTHAHNNRPASVADRKLTIESVYSEAGAIVRIDPNHTIIDDSDPDFDSWTAAELHNAMVQHFKGISANPQWKMWGLLAGKYEDAGVGGVMFDAAAQFGGAGVAPERQGFAVFRNHSWFDKLKAGSPADQDEAAAARKFLYTWVHEAGHAFNFLHAWDKARPDALSWMNYDWKYDIRHGSDAFWNRFEFQFDEDELVHLRHGNRAAVIMGGDSWSSGGHLESVPNELASAEIVDGRPPLELLIRSIGNFEFLEPVEIEIRLRNLANNPINVDGNLHPEFGTLSVFVKDPSSRVRDFEPLMCKLAEAKLTVLAPKATKKAEEGPDRLSKTVSVSFGGHGFYFDQPGEYSVRAVYRGPSTLDGENQKSALGGVLIPSNVHHISIGFPTRPEQDRLASDFFTPQVGLNLYFGGSQAPELKKGLDVLQSIASAYPEKRAAARAATVVAQAVGRPFFGLDQAENKLRKIHEQNPQEALKITDPFLAVFAQSKDEAANLPHRRLVEQRAKYWQCLDDPEQARREVQTAHEQLKARGVNSSVLASLDAAQTPMPVRASSKRTAKRKISKKKSLTKSAAKRTKKRRAKKRRR